jgi:DNA-binding SARP family transcriptional activator
MSARLDMRLLGAFSADVDGRPIPADAWRQRRAADVVKVLALSDRHRLSRDQLIDALWPGLALDAGAGNLRKAVHFARRALGGEDTIGVGGGWVELWPEGEVTTDAERFEAASGRALASGDRAACRAAAALYSGDLLPDDAYEEWCDEPRRRLRLRHLEVLRGAEMWDELLEIDPVDEEAHRELMRAHLEAGNRQAAIRQFERLRKALREHLGVGPDPRSVALYEKVLASEGRVAPTPAERARALLAWGLTHWRRRDLEEAERTATEARALAVDAGLGAELGEASALLGMIEQARGRWRAFLREELIETVRRTPALAPFVFDANLCFTEFCLYLPGGTDELARFARELHDVAQEAGSDHGTALATLMLGETELLAGSLADAEATLSRAAELSQGAGATSGHSLALERLAEAATAAGRKWSARRLLPRSLRLAEATPLTAHLPVRIYGAMVESAADAAEALTIARDAEGALARLELCEPCSMRFRVAAATAAAAAGDLATASRQLAEAERIAPMWGGGPWAAAVVEARASLHDAGGDPDEARAEFAEAARLFEAAGLPLDAERCHAAAASSRSPSR